MTIETSLASALYSSLRDDAVAPGPATADVGSGFAEALADAARALETGMRGTERTVETAVRGEADIQGLVEALTATELALETAVVVRDRVVEAYQEILRMPV